MFWAQIILDRNGGNEPILKGSAHMHSWQSKINYVSNKHYFINNLFFFFCTWWSSSTNYIVKT